MKKKEPLKSGWKGQAEMLAKIGFLLFLIGAGAFDSNQLIGGAMAFGGLGIIALEEKRGM
ncbi:MAG: hypothetical protein IJN92_09390 [Lachnospiraceae bacterium]|nr:hypothetical protein [Lachnospiraceae bacterium]